MKKARLIFYGICLFFGGLRLELLKYASAKRLERRTEKEKPLSDFVSVALSGKIHKSTMRWKAIEKRYSDIYSENMNIKKRRI